MCNRALRCGQWTTTVIYISEYNNYEYDEGIMIHNLTVAMASQGLFKNRLDKLLLPLDASSSLIRMEPYCIFCKSPVVIGNSVCYEKGL